MELLFQRCSGHSWHIAVRAQWCERKNVQNKKHKLVCIYHSRQTSKTNMTSTTVKNANDEHTLLITENSHLYGTNNNNILTAANADRSDAGQSTSKFYKIKFTSSSTWEPFWFEWDIYSPVRDSLTFSINANLDTPDSDLNKVIMIFSERGARKLFSIAEILKQHEDEDRPGHIQLRVFPDAGWFRVDLETVSQHECEEHKRQQRKDVNALCGESVCWMTCAIESLSISETMQTAIAVCNVKFKITLYWIESESHPDADATDFVIVDNEQKNEKMPETTASATAVPPLFACNPKYTPNLQFLNAIENTNIASEVKPVKDTGNFFGENGSSETQTTPATIFQTEFNSYQKQQNSKNKFLKFYSQEIICNKVVHESFQSQAFPFDCQDIPILMRLSSADPQSTAKQKLCPGMMHKNWLFISKNVSNMRAWYLRNVSIEFNNYSESGECCVLIKVSRNWMPVSLGIMLIYFSVAFLSLTTFALASSAGRLTACVSLILSIIMFSKPALPFVTFIDKYFFITFAILVLVAIQSVFSNNPLLLSSQSIIATVYALLVLIIQVTFLMSAFFTAYIERKKIHMTSKEIQKLEHNEFMEIESIDGYKKTSNNVAQIRRHYQFFQVDNVTKDDPKNKDWNKPAWAFAYEWYLLSVVCFLQIPIGILQLIHYSAGCSSSFASTNVGISQIYVYIAISCVCLIILLFAYASFGFTKLFATVIKIGVHVLTSINFVISLDFLAFWIQGNIECTSGQIPLQSIQLPLLISNVILVAVFSLFVPLFVTSVRDKLGFGFFFAFLYFVWMAFGILQLVNVPLLSSECLLNSYILPVTYIESVIVVIVPIMILLVMMLFFNVLFEIEQKGSEVAVHAFAIVLLTVFALSALIGYGMCLHCLAFWTQSSLVCIQPEFYYPMVILAAIIAGIPVWTGIFAVMYDRYARDVRNALCQLRQKTRTK